MEQRTPSALVPLIKGVVHHLVAGRYADLVADGPAADWPRDILEEKVAQIEREEGAPLVDLPDEAFEDTSRGAVPWGSGTGWLVDLRLWTARGPSAYTITFDIDTSGARPTVHLEEIEIK